MVLVSAFEVSPTDLVEFVLQHTGIQAQLAEGVLLHCLDDTIHFCVVLSRQVREVDVRWDELFAQHTCVQESQDLLCIPANRSVEKLGMLVKIDYKPVLKVD